VPGPPATAGVVVAVTVVVGIAGVPVDLVLPRLVSLRLPAIQLVARVCVPVITADAEAQRVIGTPAGRRLRWLRPTVPGPARTIGQGSIGRVPVGAVAVAALIGIIAVVPAAATASVPVVATQPVVGTVIQRVGGLT
jgi:hypothetical protein